MTMITTPVTGVDFVMFPTRDLAAAVEFYGTILGLTCSVHMPERGFAEFEAGSLTLNVAMTENFPMGYQTNPNPVALHVDDVAAARQELSGRGLRLRGRNVRHRRLPHGLLLRSRWQCADASPSLRTAHHAELTKAGRSARVGLRRGATRPLRQRTRPWRLCLLYGEAEHTGRPPADPGVRGRYGFARGLTAVHCRADG